jgi:putative tricarboxylic transport membrane protein
MWKSIDKSELIAALLLIVLGANIVYEAAQWRYLSEDGPGPGFFPLWIGILIIVLAIAEIVAHALRAAKDKDAVKINWKGSARVLFGWAGLMISIALLESIGFIASFMLLALFLVLGVFRRSLLSALAVGIGASVGFYLLFVELLGVQLPAGPWGF